MSDALITVKLDELDENFIIVQDERYPENVERIDVGPSPTWPNATERNEMIMLAVRRVLDHMYFCDTGELLHD